MDTKRIDEIADAYWRAAAAHDYDALRALFAPGAIAWSNAGGGERGVDELIAFMPLMREAIGMHSYSDARRLVGEGGFVEQHHVTSVRADGSTLDFGDVCCVVRVDGNGKITRFDEYLDTHTMREALR